MRAPRRSVVTLISLLALGFAPLRSEAQEKLGSGAPPPPAPPAEAAPQPAPPEVTWEFAADPAAVRTALLGLLEAEAFPLLGEATETELTTDFTEFAAGRFGRSVAMPPPRVSPTFPFYQTNKMQTGKVRLHALLEPNGTGTRVRVDASLLSRAMNRLTYEWTEIPRESNGTIEKYFLDKLEERLSPGRPQTAPSH
jgi:hypothetical protein